MQTFALVLLDLIIGPFTSLSSRYYGNFGPPEHPVATMQRIIYVTIHNDTERWSSVLHRLKEGTQGCCTERLIILTQVRDPARIKSARLVGKGAESKSKPLLPSSFSKPMVTFSPISVTPFGGGVL